METPSRTRPTTTPSHTQSSHLSQSSVSSLPTISIATIKDNEEEGVNVRVCVRCRPLSEGEKKVKDTSIVNCNTIRKEVQLLNISNDRKALKTYTFDKVFDAKSSQEDVFNDAVDPLVNEVLEGYNGTVFAYGQTGTGKTHTMEGQLTDDSQNVNCGVIPRACNAIFDRLQASGNEYSVRVSFLELYNEELTDLLVNASQVAGTSTLPEDEKKDKTLRLFEDPTGKKGIVVGGLEEILVENAKDVYKLLVLASARRRTACTQMNERSSRSHSIFTITIHTKESANTGEDIIKIGKLNLVDLAGSENIARSGAKNKQAKEAGHINQSLLTLGRVITALVEHLNHIPYRDSKLTRLLSESLGGRAKTIIIATVSPHASSYEETQSTLDYANRAKSIKNKPEINQKMTQRAYVKDLSSQMAMLKKENEALRLKNGIYLHPDQMAKIEADAEEQKQIILDLEAGLLAKETEMAQVQELFDRKKVELEEIIEQKIQVETKLAETSSTLEFTSVELKDTKTTLSETSYLMEKHIQTETKLGGQADKLKETLVQSISDISKLHGKIDRKAIVEEHNKLQSINLQSNVSARINALEENLTWFQSEQNSSYSSLESSIKSFMDVKTEEFSSLVEQVTNTVNNLMQKSQALSDDLMTNESENVNTLNLTLETGKNCINFTKSGVSKLSEETATKILNVQNELIQAAQNLKSWSAKVQENISSELRKFEEATVVQDKSIHNLSELVSAKHTVAENKISNTKLGVLKNQAQFNNASKLQMNEMFATMQKMMLDYQVQQETRLQTWISGVETELDEATAENNFMKEELLEVSKHLEVKFQEIQSTTSAAYSLISSDVQESVESFNAKIVECGNNVENIQLLSIAPQTAEIARYAENKFNELSDAVSSGTSYLKSSTTSGINSLISIESDAAKFNSEQTADLEKLAFRTGELGSVWVGDISQSRATQVKYISEYSTIMKDISNSMVTFLTKDIKADIPTGETPMKKDVSYPQKLAKTLPHDELLRLYRINETKDESENDENKIISQPPSHLANKSSANIKVPINFSLVIDDTENSTRPVALESTKSKRCIKAPLGPIDLNKISN